MKKDEKYLTVVSRASITTSLGSIIIHARDPKGIHFRTHQRQNRQSYLSDKDIFNGLFLFLFVIHFHKFDRQMVSNRGLHCLSAYYKRRGLNISGSMPPFCSTKAPDSVSRYL